MSYTFQSGDGTENPHRLFTEFSERVHYKDNRACGCKDSPDRIELKSRWNTYPTLDFEMPRQAHELHKVEQLMGTSYERGKIDRAVEIKSMLRELIGLT